MASDDDLFGQEHVRVYRESGGERGYRWRGTTILLLSTNGRSSGQEHTTPLIHRTDGDGWVVVASKGGAPDHPRWYKNLVAEPEATIQVRDERIAQIVTFLGTQHRFREFGLPDSLGERGAALR